MAYADALASYERFDFDDGRWTRPVFRRGSGPAVIVIHEMPGLHPLVVRFADRVAAAGMTVFMPSLFGEPGRPVSVPYVLGEMREGNLHPPRVLHLGRQPVEPDRRLAAGARAEGARGVRRSRSRRRRHVLHGRFRARDDDRARRRGARPVAALACRFPVSADRRAALGVSPDEIACAKRRFEAEDLSMIGLRFFGDRAVPDARFETYRRTFGERFEAIEIRPEDAQPGTGASPHSVLTIHLRDDDPDGPTKRAETRVIEFFRQRVGA